MTTYSVETLIQTELDTRPHEFTNWSKLLKSIKDDRRFEGAYIGSYSCTLKDKSVTYVASNHTWCERPVSASTIARAAMRPVLDVLKRKRIYWCRFEKPFLEVPQPLYAMPVADSNRLIYCDIKACYWNIIRRMPIDLRWGGRKVHWGEITWQDILPDDIGEYKLLRNCIPGIWRGWNGRKVKEGRIACVGTINPLLSPIHWGVLGYLLHMIALKAVDLGAQYYNTDGAIFQRDEDAIAWIDWLSDLGLLAEPRHVGTGHIWGVGHYQIGTQRWGANTIKPRPFSNLGYSHSEVLTAWKRWSTLKTVEFKESDGSRNNFST